MASNASPELLATTLTPSQRRAFDLIEEGHNVFLTGAGGTGKSYLIDHIRTSREEDKVAITALTGCAALLLGQGAKTIYSWAGIGLGKESVETLITRIRKNGRAKKNWRATELLIIDEVSMMSLELFEKLDQIARLIRNRSAPFGGIQLVLVGDFFQLPPITPAGTEVKFAFESPAWADAVTHSIELEEVKRQSDPVFKDILTAARRGALTEDHLATLRSRKGLNWKDEAIRPTLLFSRRAEVDAINDANLKALSTVPVTYQARTVYMALPEGKKSKTRTVAPPRISLNDPDVKASAQQIDKNAPYQPELVLAVGAQVMLVYNLDIEAGLVNGSRGVVTGFTAATQTPLPIVTFRTCTRPIDYHGWPLEDYPGVVREQIPLILAYAQTIHKCQGSTLDSALIDIGRKTFEYGQAYVALSRVKSLDSLYIWDIDPAALKVNPKVTAFYEAIRSQTQATATATATVTADPHPQPEPATT